MKTSTLFLFILGVAGMLTAQQRERNASVSALAYSPDGGILASADTAGVIKLWDRVGGGTVVTIPANRGGVAALLFDPASGRLLADGRRDSYVRIFDLKTKKEATEWFHSSGSLAMTPGGGRVVAADGKDVEVLDAVTGKILNVSSTDEFRIGPNPPTLTVIAHSATGNLVANADASGNLYVRDSEYLMIHARPTTQRKPINAVAFSADVRYLVAADAEKITVWKVTPAPSSPAAVDSWSATRVITQVGMRALSPVSGGSAIAAAGSDGALYLLDAATGASRKLPGPVAGALCVTVSPGGERAAVGYEDGSIEEWDLRSGTATRVFGADSANSQAAQLETSLGHPSRVISVSAHPRGKWVASASEDGTVILWDPKTFHQLRSLPGRWQVRAISAYPTRNELAILEDEEIAVWNVDTWRQSETRRLIRPKPRSATGLDDASIVASMALNPDWSAVAYGFNNGDVEIVPQTPGGPAGRFNAAKTPVFQMSFSPDGTRLATWSNLDGEVRLWKLFETKPEKLLPIGETTNVRSLAVSPSQVAAWVEGSGPRIWNIGGGAPPDLATAAAEAWHGRQIFNCWGMAFNFDSKMLLAGADDGSLQRFQLAPPAWIRPAAAIDRPSEVAFDPSGAEVRILSVQNFSEAYSAEQAWDARTGTHEETRQETIGIPLAIDGKVVWSAGSYYNGLAFRAPASGDEVRVPSVDQVSAVRISPSGSFAAVRRYDGKLWMISRAEAKKTAEIDLSQFSDHPSGVLSWFNQDETAFIIYDASAKHDAAVFDPVSGRRLGTIPAQAGRPLAASVDQRMLITVRSDYSFTGDRYRLELRELESGKLLREIDHDSDGFGAISFSHDGNFMAGGLHRNMVRIWNLKTGDAVATFEGHSDAISATAFNPSGEIVASASADGTTRLWRIRDLAPLCTVVSMNRGKDWAVFAPDGRFDGTETAWKQIQWRFSDRLDDVASAEAFFGDFFTPGLLGDVLQGRPAPAQHIADKDRRSPMVQLSSKAGGAPDRVSLSIVARESPADQAHKRGSGVRDLRLFRNGLLVGYWPGEVGSAKTIDLPLAAGKNRFKAYAFNRDNVKSEDAPEIVIEGPASTSGKPRLYIVGIGVDNYSNADFKLQYAVADAKSIIEEIATFQKSIDRYEVVPVLLADATRASITREIGGLSKSVRPDDAVILFFAGHGIAWNGSFYMLPSDLGFDGRRSEINDVAEEKLARNGISDKGLDTLLRDLDVASIALIIDSCNSGQALEAAEKRRGPLNTAGLAQLAWEKGISILTASQSFEAATEDSHCGHGLLTCALVEDGLKKGEADRAPKDGKITMTEWLEFAADRVPQLQIAEAARGVRRNVNSAVRQRPRIYVRDTGEESLTIRQPSK